MHKLWQRQGSVIPRAGRSFGWQLIAHQINEKDSDSKIAKPIIGCTDGTKATSILTLDSRTSRVYSHVWRP